MFKNIFLFSLLIVCVNTVAAEELSDISVNSSAFSNSINENKYPLHIIQDEEINANKSIGDNLKGMQWLPRGWRLTENEKERISLLHI